MFSIFKKKAVIDESDEETYVMDKILSGAKVIIDNGYISEDDSYSRSLPSVKFEDGKGNTLFIEWYNSTKGVSVVRINNKIVPNIYDAKIYQMAQDRIQVLRKEHLEKVVDSII